MFTHEKMPRTGADDAGQSALIKKLPAVFPPQRTFIEYTPTHMAFDVQCPDAGWVFVTERWAPGWRARIDGEPVTLFGGGFIFRAVQVTGGTHRIEFCCKTGRLPVPNAVELGMPFCGPHSLDYSCAIFEGSLIDCIFRFVAASLLH